MNGSLRWFVPFRRLSHLSWRRGSTSLLFLFVALLVVSSTRAADVPDPPAGFSWRQVPQIDAAFVVPDGWHYLEENKGKTLAVFITRESIPEVGEFETGVSINVYLDNPSAPAQVKAMVEGIARDHGSKVSTAVFGPFIRLNTRFDSVKEIDEKLIRTILIAIINVRTHTTYMVTFESPVDLWERFWPIGEVVINRLQLETEM